MVVFSVKSLGSIITDDEMHVIVGNIMSEMNLYEDEDITYRDLVNHINECKDIDTSCSYFQYLIDSQCCEEVIRGINEKILQGSDKGSLTALKFDKVYYLYLLWQANNYYLDFHDLILVANYLFRKNQFILRKWASKFHYILVDEFQDLTGVEYEFINYLASVHGRIFGVGDPDQSIYGFRGSDVGIFNTFYSSCDEHFDFTENYRSYQQILDLSHDLISQNTSRITDIKLHCFKGRNVLPKLVHTIDRNSEAIYIAEKIQSFVKNGAKYSDCAILYRNNQCSLVFEDYFQRKKIPYKVYSTNEFFKCEEIKTAIAYLKFIVYKDNISFLTIYKKPVRYISNAMINNVKKLSSIHGVSYWQVIKDDYKNPIYNKKFTKLVSFVEDVETADPNDDFEAWCLRILNESGFLNYIFSTGDEDKVNHIKQLIDMIHSFEPDDPTKNMAEQFLNNMSLLSDGDVKDEEDKVQMMTIHCSKGMQYRYVFVVDFNEGYIPSSKTETKKDYEEERRVAYVAFTRAEDELYILESKGDDGKGKVSEFAEAFVPINYRVEQYVAREKIDTNCITVGTYVKNKLYGKGIVTRINTVDNKCSVRFDEEQYREREVDLSLLIPVHNHKELNIDIDLNLVEEIKKDIRPKYTIGEIVIHKEYGAGIITKIKDKNHAFIQFKEIGSIFDLDSNYIIKRSDYLKYLNRKEEEKE